MRGLIIRENMKHWGILCGSIVLNTIVAALICTGLEGSLFR
jgi:hypothetical protein